MKANASPVYEGDRITGYISIRSKPTRAETEAAGRSYALFQSGQAAGLAIKEGRVVKTSQWSRLKATMQSFRFEIFSSLALLVAALVVSLECGAWALNRIAGIMISSKTNGNTLTQGAIPLLSVTKDIRFDVVQIQQWLQDVSATQAKDGMDDGFGFAAQFLDSLKKDVATAKDLAGKLEQKEIVASLDAVLEASGPYYDAGVEMAKSYVASGPEGGNRLMSSFDGKASAITDGVDALSAATSRYIDEVAASSDATLGGGHDLISFVFRLGLLPLVLGILATAFAVYTVVQFARLIVTIADATQRAANGQKLAAMPGASRRDEIGIRSRAVQTFVSKVDFAELERQEQAVLAGRERTMAMTSMAEKVETETGTVTEQMIEVSAQADDAQIRATEVNDLSAKILEVVNELQSAVVRSIRTATDEVDRRGDDRLEAALSCRVVVHERSLSGRVSNISHGGAAIEFDEETGNPLVVQVDINGVGAMLGLNVIASTETTVRGSFEPAMVSRTRLPDVLEGIRKRGGYRAA